MNEPNKFIREIKESLMILSLGNQAISEDKVVCSTNGPEVNTSRGRMISDNWFRIVPRLPKMKINTTEAAQDSQDSTDAQTGQNASQCT